MKQITEHDTIKIFNTCHVNVFYKIYKLKAHTNLKTTNGVHRRTNYGRNCVKTSFSLHSPLINADKQYRTVTMLKKLSNFAHKSFGLRIV